MVASCCAYGCTNRFKAGCDPSFHSMPKDPQLLSKWLHAIRRKDFIPSKSSKLCSAHFTADDFKQFTNIKTLKESAIPSIFTSFPSYYQTKCKSQRPIPKANNITEDVLIAKKCNSKGLSVKKFNMVGCFAVGCNHENGKHFCRFFRFPKDKELMMKWRNLVRRTDKTATSSNYLCSCHFVNGQKNNLPTIFSNNVEKQILELPETVELLKPSCHFDGQKKNPPTIFPHNKEKQIFELPESKEVLKQRVIYVCWVPNCFHRNNKESCRFFLFPKLKDVNIKTQKKWRNLYKRIKKHRKKDSRICSCHFIDGEIENGPLLTPRDIETAFNIPHSVKMNFTSQKLELQRNEGIDNTSNISDTYCSTSETSEDTESTISDIDLYYLENSKKNLTDPSAKISIHFNVDNIMHNDTYFYYYTGLTSYEIFECLFSFFDQTKLNIVKYVTELPLEDQLLLVLMKLKNNFSYIDLSVRFKIPPSVVVNIFFSWLLSLHKVLCERALDIGNWGCQTRWEEIPQCSMLVDCITLWVEPKPVQDKDFNHREKKKSLKGLLGVTPGGLVTYASSLYSGDLEDEDLINEACITSVVNTGDIVMVHENSISFVKSISDPRLVLSQPPSDLPEPASSLIMQHLSKVAHRVLQFSILKYLPQDLSAYWNRIWQVICALHNFQTHLLEDIEPFYRGRYLEDMRKKT